MEAVSVKGTIKIFESGFICGILIFERRPTMKPTQKSNLTYAHFTGEKKHRIVERNGKKHITQLPLDIMKDKKSA